MAKLNDTKPLEQLCLKTYGTTPDKMEKMPLSGSNRQYYKIDIAGSTIVGTVGLEVRENQAFISLAYFVFLVRVAAFL